MNFTIKRSDYRPDGIFSFILNENNEEVFATLEHAYEDEHGGYEPKIPPGKYSCQRGLHRLHGMTEDFETFEILGVEGHDGLLFHCGNFNKDSEGCILVGEKVADFGQSKGVTNSRFAFAQFMKMQEGVNMFQLTVVA